MVTEKAYAHGYLHSDDLFSFESQRLRSERMRTAMPNHRRYARTDGSIHCPPAKQGRTA
ncbi:MAG: hypothetical protein ACLVJ6_00230 [Merdibacter sp.]